LGVNNVSCLEFEKGGVVMKKHFCLSSKYVFGLLVLVLALSLTLGMAYGQAVHSQRGLTRAIEVQKRNFDTLRAIPGVVGAGTGIGRNGQPVIMVFTMKPGIRGIPPKLEEIPVEVKVTGMFVAYSDPIDPTARFERPVPIGVSTGHPDITAGTIGCRVKDGSGNVYALSNNHVYADTNKASTGDSALQPGSFDGGKDPTDKIGELWDYQIIDFSIFGSNKMDAAIAISSPSYLGCSTPSDGYGTPNSETKSAEIGLAVQKYGRTTGWRHSQISAINVTVAVCYARCRHPFRAELAWFDDQILIPHPLPILFSDGGDSGSLIVTDDSDMKPVGLLFAGSDTDTLANRIELVLKRFGVTVDDCSGSELCTDDAGCDDGLACNGAETCVEGTCQAGTPSVCDDGVSCTVDTCNEPGGDCSYVAYNSLCDDGLYCNGEETCDPLADCQVGTDPCTPGEVCLEDSDICCTPTDEICNDGADNDCDGFTDCSDSNCEGDSNCSCLPLGSICSSDSDCCSSKCRGRPGGKICR
jgi:hypothetical protein